MNKKRSDLPLPDFFDPKKVGEVWRVAYQDRAAAAKAWAAKYGLKPAAADNPRICLMPIDCQNTFCLPDFELFVGGRSGKGAIEDNVRLCEFIYRNLGVITEIDPTMDTHTAMQIFHPLFWINDQGENPVPAATMITLDEVQRGVWKVNPAEHKSTESQILPTKENPLIIDKINVRLLIYTEVHEMNVHQSNVHWGVVFKDGKFQEGQS